MYCAVDRYIISIAREDLEPGVDQASHPLG
jgi:hypothetical protein